MKTFKEALNQIIADGPQVIEHTKEYKQKVKNLQTEITSKYEQMLRKEKNLFKRVLLRLRKREEIRRAIQELTSPGKLYVSID
jgi:fructose-1,6-bisphosphatase